MMEYARLLGETADSERHQEAKEIAVRIENAYKYPEEEEGSKLFERIVPSAENAREAKLIKTDMSLKLNENVSLWGLLRADIGFVVFGVAVPIIFFGDFSWYKLKYDFAASLSIAAAREGKNRTAKKISETCVQTCKKIGQQIWDRCS